ncbi:hypothetical protein JRO89_XS11G0134400 [Xanthoceras sorbifolium]|uniref:Major facilitator superfamily (MFS) profile domain-containing protein n=1 Tax=Xanthoceras sorbifolium TaxID=99658 RepID=A0ABQ8HFJ8_9ROSI|nr:hypothetical protein JRO89_XS11G0134400 [Xanthoceras sorbifolium]
MAVGAAITSGGQSQYSGKMTVFVVLSCMIAAMGGVIFGYDIGISGGVTSMEPFLEKFFPEVYKKMKADTKISNYCKFDSQLLTSFTSSLYVAGLVASFFASSVTRAFGRKPSILVGGVAFLSGAALGGAALNVYMLILGRILLGVGVGFANQSVPLYLSEMAPPIHRGAINIGFQLCVGIGVLSANLINFGTQKIEGGWGWRISLAMAAVPASILTLGALFLPETPNSLIQRKNDSQKAKLLLQKVRGTDDVQPELDDLIKASAISKTIKHPFKKIIQRKYRPQLVMAIVIPFFQQVTGINVISFYAPILFITLGLGESAALMSAVVTGLVGTFSTFLSMLAVDKLGRKTIFLTGGIQMFLSQILVGGIMAAKLGDHGGISTGYTYIVLVLICAYVSGFGWSWGPLGWLVPSEIFSLEVRSAGQSITVAVGFLFTFLIAQTFLAMLCHLKAGIFFFFGGWVVVMTSFVYFLLPETKNVPIEQMERVWRQHWFWKRIVGEVGDEERAAIMSGGGQSQYSGKMTVFVVLSCMVAAMGGVIFGYDIGISDRSFGGVTSMKPFLEKFFPEVYTKMKEDTKISNYCKFDSQLLTSFTSSLYVAGLVASFFASSVTRAFGRKPSILAGGVAFLAGAAIGGAALNVYMLIFGRVLLGVGVGFANQSVPLYLSEMAPAKHRGAINNGFQFCVGIGALSANLINYGTEKIEGGWGWRISLGMAAVPASMLALGALFLPETPNSLIQRKNDPQKAKLLLQKVRGTDNVQPELDDLIKASAISKTIKHPFKKIIQRKYRPQLVMAIAIPFFQQVTGINVIAFYAPILFITLGLGESAALMSAVLTGFVGTFSTFVSMLVVDKLGRKSLFLIGGIQMVLSQILVGGIMAAKLGDHGEISKGYAYIVLVLICVYVAGFGWSWGPLGWLVPSEIFSMEIRSAGQSITVAVSFLFTFIIAQTFLAMLCHLKAGIFFFFGGWVVVMTSFVYFLLPETKNVPIEQMERVWRQHWFWKRIVGEVGDEESKIQES